MGFYRKKLSGVDDLERERKALLKEKEELENEEFFSLEGILGRGKKGDKGKGGDTAANEDEGGLPGLDSLVALLPMAGPLVNIVTGIVGDKAGDLGSVIGKKGKGIALKLVKEVIGGYLKWKAIELGYKGIRQLLKKTKEKQEGQQ